MTVKTIRNKLNNELKLRCLLTNWKTGHLKVTVVYSGIPTVERGC